MQLKTYNFELEKKLKKCEEDLNINNKVLNLEQNHLRKDLEK